MRTSLSIFVTIIFLSTTLNAQNDTSSIKNLLNLTIEELLQIKVYTASKIEQKASESPATVYVITSQQIEQRNYSSVKEILDDIPQVEIQRKSASQNTDIFTLNGVAGNEKFVILMDGIRINSTTGTEHCIGENYALSNAKQVEIILGPVSSLYGAEAFTGIINIITYKGCENKGFKVNSSYGSFNTTDNTVVYGNGNNLYSFVITGKYYHSDEPFFPKFYRKDYAWYNQYAQTGEMLFFGDTVTTTGGIKPWETPTDAYSVTAKVTLKNFELGYSLLSESHCSSISMLPATNVFSKETIWANMLQNAYISNSLVSSDKKLLLNSTIFSQQFKIDPKSMYLNQYSGYVNAYKYERNRTLKMEEQFTYKFTNKFIAVGGISYEFINAIPKTSDLPYKYDEKKSANDQNIYYPGTHVTDINGNDLTIIQDIYNVNYHNIGSYIQLQYKVLKKIAVTAGTRYDYDSRYKSTINPRIGMVYNPVQKVTLKLLYGQSNLFPSSYKTYQHYGTFYPITNSSGQVTGLASGFWHLPNLNLEPEKRTSYEVFASYQFTQNLAVSVNGYYGIITNLIENTNFENTEFHGIPVSNYRQAINKGIATAFGGTFRIDYKSTISPLFATDIFAAYTFSDGEIADNPLIFSAKNTLKVGIGLQYATRFNLYTKILYRTGSHYRFSTYDNPILNNPFTLINLSANYKLFMKSKFKATLFINVFNLANAKYYNAGGENFTLTPQDPFRIDFGLKIQL